MAFKWIDDSAVLSLDDGTNPSAMMRQTQQNVEQLHNSRLPAISWTSSKLATVDKPAYLSSIWPAAAVIGMVDLPDSEVWESIDVRIRTLDTTDADVYVYATVGDLSGGIIPPPVRDRSQWKKLTAGGGVQMDQLTALIPPSMQVAKALSVLLWVWSDIDSTPESSGTLSATATSPGQLTLTKTAGVNPPTGGYIGRAISFGDDPSGKGEDTQYGMLHQIGNHDGSSKIFTTPPVYWFDADFTNAINYQIFKAGQIELTGAVCVANPPAFPAPGKSAFRTDQDMDERVLQLAKIVSQHAKERLPNWGSGPQQHGNSVWWPLRSGSGSGDEDRIDGTWRIMARCPVAGDVPPETANSGHKASMLFAVSYSGENTTRPISLDFRLAAYTAPGAPAPGTLFGFGSTVTLDDIRNLALSERWSRARFSSLIQTLRLAPDFPWQFRGLLQFSDLETVGGLVHHDYTRLVSVTVEADLAGLTFPSTLAIEARISGANPFLLTSLVVGANFAMRGT